MTKKQIEEIIGQIAENLDGEWDYEGNRWSLFENQLHELVWEHTKPAIENALKNIQLNIAQKEKATIRELKNKVQELENKLEKYSLVEEMFEVKKKGQ